MSEGLCVNQLGISLRDIGVRKHCDGDGTSQRICQLVFRNPWKVRLYRAQRSFHNRLTRQDEWIDHDRITSTRADWSRPIDRKVGVSSVAHAGKTASIVNGRFGE